MSSPLLEWVASLGPAFGIDNHCHAGRESNGSRPLASARSIHEHGEVSVGARQSDAKTPLCPWLRRAGVCIQAHVRFEQRSDAILGDETGEPGDRLYAEGPYHQ